MRGESAHRGRVGERHRFEAAYDPLLVGVEFCAVRWPGRQRLEAALPPPARVGRIQAAIFQTNSPWTWQSERARCLEQSLIVVDPRRRRDKQGSTALEFLSWLRKH